MSKIVSRVVRAGVAAAVAAATLVSVPVLVSPAASAAGALVDGAPTQPAPRRAVGPARAFLSGLTLHPGRGKATVRVKLPASSAKNLTLLGKTPLGYAVVDDSVDPIRFYTVETTGSRIGFARRFWQQFSSPRGVDVYLSDDGTRVLMENDGRRSGQEFTVFSIYGKKIDQVLIPGNGTGLLDFTGARAVMGIDGAVANWKIGTAPTKLTGLEGSGAYIAGGLLFRHSSSGLDGPVALSAPRGPLLWAVPGFDPFVVSPSGTYVLGFAGRTAGAATVVRNRKDGALRSSVPLGDYDKMVGWEDNTHYLVSFRSGQGNAIGRCAALTGECVRVTSVTRTRVTLSVGSAFLKDRAR